ncbi:helix-turn-helix domain-containing protein [Pseudomonas citronellolis]|uniref:helix-turn-helix domain-containing protein n=1 Tax=Pseudomonas citronellolis TaxID=53408 RepID=UPI000AC922BF
MSIKISSLVWEHYPVGSCELLTALAYADHAHDDGTIRPSVAYIARKTRQSERSVQRHLAQMRKSGWLLTVRYANGGRSFVTEYRVNPCG